jgi:hypothetical protein
MHQSSVNLASSASRAKCAFSTTTEMTNTPPVYPAFFDSFENSDSILSPVLSPLSPAVTCPQNIRVVPRIRPLFASEFDMASSLKSMPIVLSIIATTIRKYGLIRRKYRGISKRKYQAETVA